MTLNHVFNKYGRRVHLFSVSTEWQGPVYKAFVQPLRYKNKMYLEDIRVSIGVGDMGYYLYLGPAEHDLTEIDKDDIFLQTDDMQFFVTRAEKIHLRDETLYIWAVLKCVREAEE